jgi:hypothetical protein
VSLCESANSVVLLDDRLDAIVAILTHKIEPGLEQLQRRLEGSSEWGSAG